MCRIKDNGFDRGLGGFPPSVQTKSQISDRQPDVAANFLSWHKIGSLINCFYSAL